MKFTVYGKIQGKARPRFTRQGIAYTPKKTVEYENIVKDCYVLSGGINYDTAPIQIKITAYYKKAKSNKMLQPTLKPDADNIAKIVCDGLNGIAYKDDKQIVSLTVLKVWTDGIERVEVDISEFPQMDKTI